MKLSGLLCVILLLSVLSGCSKPETPKKITPPPKKQTPVKKYIAKINTSAPEIISTNTVPEPQAMADVRITDADTGLPIFHAAVRVRWTSDDGPEMCPGIHIEGGNYQVPTNAIKGAFYVGALADGYLPSDKENPKFPVELTMKPGDTIKVSGTIHHANGDPVTNGIINLRMLNTYLWGTQWPLLYPCSVIPDSKGTFILSHVPAGIDGVYPKYDLPKNSAVYFTDQSFSTSDSDVYLTLQLPPEITVKGQVLFSSGTAVSGAWVWIENVPGEAPDSWNTKLADTKQAVSGATIQSDAQGCFALTLLNSMDRYVVKAFHPAYTVAYSGPFSDNNPPPDPVALIIQEEGARLFGGFRDTAGNPVTNCVVQYSIYKNTSLYSSDAKSNKLQLNIAEDGSYVSATIPAGIYDLSCKASGYYEQYKSVVVRENAMEQCDVVFAPFCTITGTVYDADTRQPIPDVFLNNVRPAIKNSNFSPFTDIDGKFWVLCDNDYLNIHFQHPEYVSTRCYFSKPEPKRYTSQEEINRELHPAIYLSKGGSIRIFGQKSNGQPLDGYNITFRLAAPNLTQQGKYEYFGNYLRAKLVEGEALITNVPSMLSPLIAQLYTKDFRRLLASSPQFDVVAGEETSATITLPTAGTLVLNFLNPIDFESIDIQGSRIGRNSSFGSSYFHKYDFLLDKQQMTMIALSTNEYRLKVEKMSALLLETNIIITANNTTEIMINNKTNDCGVIRGIVTAQNGIIIQYIVTVREQSPGKQIIRSQVLHDSVFAIDKLSPDSLYDLTVDFYRASGTNITIKNIAPDGPPLEIQLPDAYRLTGNVIDGDGNPLHAKISIKSNRVYGPGEFKLYPVFPGTHTVSFSAQNYPVVFRTITVFDSDVDMGDIVISDKGISLSGRVVTKDNSPAGNATVAIQNNTMHTQSHYQTDSDGYFHAKALPREAAFSVNAYYNGATATYETKLLSSDTNIGDIVLKP